MPVVLLAVVAFAVAGCGGKWGIFRDAEQMSPGDVHMIPKAERALVEAVAKQGDLESARRLIAHHEALLGSDDLAGKWKATARAIGDSNELYFYACTAAHS